MSEHAHADVDAIHQLRRGLVSFRQDAAEAARLAGSSAAEVVARIGAELASRREALRAAEAALAACLCEPEVNCGGCEAAVERAASRQGAAEQALRGAERALAGFRPQSERFVRECERLEGEGGRLLGLMAEGLDAYLAVSGGDGASATIAGERAGISERFSPEVAAAPPSGLPDGWAIVSLAEIDDSDTEVAGPGSFGKGYSPADLAWAFEALHEVVLPAMAHGCGADYFQRRDRSEGRRGTRSYSDTYSGFFGDDSAIRLERRPDGAYRVANGRHRVWVARRMGLDGVPGRVR